MEWAIAIAVLAAVVAGTYFGWRWWKHRNDGKPPEPDEVKREELKEAGLLEQPSIPVWRSETTTLPADKPFAPPSHHAPAVKSRAVRAAVAKARARKAKKAARHG